MSHSKRALAAVALLLVGCIDPSDRRPGLWLSGDRVTDPVSDWSFVDSVPEIFIETRTPYGIRHSITAACAARGGDLYVGARNPATKRWVRYVERDPEVRLEIEGRIYERSLERLDSEGDRRAAYRAYASKYGWPEMPAADAPEVRFFRVVERR